MAATIAGISALALSSAPAGAQEIVHAISPQATLGDSDYQLMRQAQIGMLRLGFGWDGVQSGPGACSPAGHACDWSYMDRQIGGAASHGMQVMPIVYGSAPFVNADPAVAPVNDLASWQQFVHSAVERYGPGGAFWGTPYQAQFGSGAPVVPVRFWQLWNEPSSYQFFHPKPNTKQYAQILRSASTAIKSVDPGATILLGGVFGETGPKGIPMAKFFKQLYKVKGIAASFDAVAIHPYAANSKSLLKQVFAIRKAIVAAKDKKAKVWVTELGYSSGCPGCKKKNMPTVAMKSDAAQAKALVKAYKALKKNRKKLNLGGIVWFSWQDVNNPDTCRFCQLAGLVDINGQPKPAYFAFLKAIAG